MYYNKFITGFKVLNTVMFLYLMAFDGSLWSAAISGGEGGIEFLILKFI